MSQTSCRNPAHHQFTSYLFIFIGWNQRYTDVLKDQNEMTKVMLCVPVNKANFLEAKTGSQEQQEVISPA